MSVVFLGAPGPVFIDPNKQTVINNQTITGNGSAGPYTGFGCQEIQLVVNITGAVSGTITFTIKELDPVDQTTVLQSKSGAGITATGTQVIILPATFGDTFSVSWVVSGGTPSFAGTCVTLLGKATGARLGLTSDGILKPLICDSSGYSVLVGAGTAGSPAGGVITIQGVGSGTAIPISGSVGQGTGAAATAPWSVELTDGSSFYTAAKSTQFPAALVSGRLDVNVGSGTVTANQGTANTAANRWPVYVTDGTNNLPTMDAVGRRGYVSITDGTNSMPTMDVAGRSGFQKITDGTNTAAVKAASTAAQATDPSLVVGLSPNSPLPTGSNTIGTVNQGNAAALSSGWPVKVTDGTNTMPTMDTVGRAGFLKVTDGTNTAAVKAASTAAQATDPSLVVGLSPNSPLPTGSNTIGAVTGTKGNNAGAPGTTNLGVLPVLANAAAPSWTEGNQVALSSLLNGSLRTDNTSWLGSTAPTVGQKTMANSIPVTFASDQSTIQVVLSSPAGSTTGYEFGRVALAGGTSGLLVKIEGTTYTEQTTNAQRSIASSSASDASAGVGARTVKVTYYDQTGAGPYNETVTLNGVTAVNTVATNICFIESMEVMTVGSTGWNVGTITLYVSTGGTGGTISTIAVGSLAAARGDMMDFWGHHYVPTGKTARLATIVCGASAASVIFLMARNPTSATSGFTMITEFLNVPAGGSFTRNLTYPVTISGPAVIQAWGIPSTNNVTLNASFDFAEQ